MYFVFVPNWFDRSVFFFYHYRFRTSIRRLHSNLLAPPDGDGFADLRYVLGVAKNIGTLLKKDEYKVIVDKSTVPVGTAEKVYDVIFKSIFHI